MLDVLGALTILTFAMVGQESRAPPSLQESATQVDDVVVEGRPLEELIADFVDEASAPSRGRGLARWQDEVCVGVLNLRREAAQYVADRVSEVAMGLGVEPGEPGCRANVVVVFTSDGQALAAQLAEAHRRAFRAGTGGLDRGNVAFEAFVTSEQPVRWWHNSMPVNAETGRRAIRLPGDVDPTTGQPAAPTISVFSASRINSQLRDDLRKVMVIVDVEKLGSTNLVQLTDYIAFVALAQVDLGGSFAQHDSILKLFEAPEQAPDGLTDWDRSYLETLYRVLDAPQRRVDPTSVADGVADSMTRERRAAQNAADPEVQ